MSSSPDAEDPDRYHPMGRTYTLVVVCEAAVITALWLFKYVFTR